MAQGHNLCHTVSVFFGCVGILFLQCGQPKADQFDRCFRTTGISVIKAEIIDLFHQIVIHGNAETGFFSGHSQSPQTYFTSVYHFCKDDCVGMC